MSEEPRGLYIGGEWRRTAVSGEVVHKWSGTPITRVALASVEDVADATLSAKLAQRNHPLPPRVRASVLRDVASGILDHAEALASIICQEAGKPIRDSRLEVVRAAETFALSAEEATRIHGEQIPIESSPGNEDRIAFTTRAPVGVVAAISPFNFPLNLVAHKVAPALAAGNAVVLKPATWTPLSAIALCQIIEDAGLPPGYLNLVVGPGATVGEALLSDPNVDLYTFTGSPSVGRHIKARSGLRRVVLELGNNSPNIVCADADVDRAADLLAGRAYGYSGQFCISVQRIYVERAVLERFRERFVAAALSLRVGDPEDPDTDVGPMIDEEEACRAERWVFEAVESGARLVFGGERSGSVFSPTLLENVTQAMKVVRDEAFAPVASVIPIDSLAEGIDGANASDYGLQVGLFTSDLATALAAAQTLRYGGVIINDTSAFRADLMPYGGVRSSGIGREGPRYAIEEMTDLRTIVMRA